MRTRGTLGNVCAFVQELRKWRSFTDKLLGRVDENGFIILKRLKPYKRLKPLKRYKK